MEQNRNMEQAGTTAAVPAEKKNENRKRETVGKDVQAIRTFLESVGIYEADALRVSIAIADGKITIDNISGDDRLALNRYLNSSTDNDRLTADNAQEHRLNRAFGLLERVSEFCDGYMEQWEYKNSYIGTPQGGIISPILANIYLDKLDKFMRNYINVFNKGKARVRNPEYKRVANRKDKRVKKLKNETDEQKKEALRREIAILHREMQQLPATLDMDENFKRMRYVRYADDFLICVIGSKEDCVKAKGDIKTFLQDTLKLELSDEKTLITNSHDAAKFLGFDVTVRSTDKTRKDFRGIPIRSLDHKVVLLLPYEVMRKKLLDYNAMRIIIKNGKEAWESTSRPYLRSNDDLEILNRYNSEIRGIYNYYCIANNVNILNSFYYYMKESMYKTLSSKYESTVRKIIRKYCRNKVFTVRYENNKGEMLERTIYHGGFKQRKDARIDNAHIMPSYRGTESTSLMARLKARECEYCGAEDNLRMVHVRKLKDLKGKQEWERFMIARQRKTIAVCENCYRKIHEKK